uniref:Tectonin beta-propeller repeat containing 2 n=1 Tax=Gadus morhua TaxID=8049 RepID=A0A8C5F8C0_GADMO
MATPTPPQSILREFCPLYYLLNSIPEKVQKGFRSVLVYLTALDSSRDFIAVGSSIGVLYLYSRRLSHMDKHHIKGKSEAITAVKLLSCFDDLVAVGTASGRVTVFQLVSQLPGRNKQLRRFDVLGLHKSTVTCLAWSTNGAKLFSGDDKGRVVFTALELDKGECKPVIFLEEASGIVQLEYSHTVLLVCSQQRALFFSTQQQVLQQMGTKPRKSGRFGACFLPALCKQSDLQVLAARPGFRLWRADIQGLAEDAQLFKDLSSTPVPEFQLFPRPSTAGAYHPAERQLGLLSCFHRDGWLLSWNEYSVYVVDCLNEVVIGALESCGDIVAVSSCQNEVFILKGDRDIIRVSSCPEGQTPCKTPCTSPAGPPLLVHPSLPIARLMTAASPDQRRGSTHSRSSSVTSWDSGSTSLTPDLSELGSKRYSASLDPEELQQELVVKAIRVKKRMRRGRKGRKPVCLLPCLTAGFVSPPRSETLTKGSVLVPKHSNFIIHRNGSVNPFPCPILNPPVWVYLCCRYVWCLDFKGVLFCSPLPDGGLKWQRFEDNIHQVAVSPSGGLLWKVEQKTMTAYACGKVSIKGKRHWYKALDLTASVALSNNAAWILRTNGDLYLQTGLSAERPCARSVKVETPCSFSQVCARGGVVWALSEEGAVFYREGLSSYCCEGDSWRNDKISEAQGVQLMCVSLGPSGVVWALDASGALWFRTGVSPASPQGEDHHWWQISITDYVVFDQGSLFQTLLQATHSVATVTRTPVERVAECLRVAFLSQQAQCQPSLVSANPSGVWIASGRNHLHVARGNLVGTFWQNVVPRGTVSSTRWTFITTSVLPYRPGTFLWVAQSRKDLFCIWDQDGELRPSSVTLPPEVELSQLSACGDALWGLDTHGYVHIRTLSPTCPIGMHWARLDLSQLGGARLVSVSCGGQNVWAVDTQGMVYFRVGTQPLNPSMMLPAWICIEPPVQPVGVQLVSIHSSPNDRQLWALDNRGSVHVRTGLNEEMPVGTDWEQVPGLAASQLVLSVRTVWVRCPNGEIARRYGNTARNPAGDYWKRIPGMSHWLAGEGVGGEGGGGVMCRAPIYPYVPYLLYLV